MTHIAYPADLVRLLDRYLGSRPHDEIDHILPRLRAEGRPAAMGPSVAPAHIAERLDDDALARMNLQRPADERL